jgi:prefoldin subunit 5
MNNEINTTLESLKAAADELNKKIAALQAAKNVVDEVNEAAAEEADDFSDFEFEEIDNSCHKAKSGSGK